MSRPVVVLVEDNADDEELALLALRKAGINDVIVARDGQQALQVLDECAQAGKAPDLVFLDLKLPRLDGLEVLEAVRRHDTMRAYRIAILSSAEDPNELRKCEALGVVAILEKPLTVESLRAVLPAP